MRIMDCVLLLFQKKIDPVTMDPEKPCVKPSWTESLKVSEVNFGNPGKYQLCEEYAIRARK